MPSCCWWWWASCASPEPLSRRVARYAALTLTALLAIDAASNVAKGLRAFRDHDEAVWMPAPADEELRGFGAPLTKSLLLLSVSCAPFSLRSAAVEFDSVGAAAPSKTWQTVKSVPKTGPGVKDRPGTYAERLHKLLQQAGIDAVLPAPACQPAPLGLPLWHLSAKPDLRLPNDRVR